MKLNPPVTLLHADAREILCRAVDKAEELRMSGCFVVVDGAGMVVSLSRMDRGSPGGLYVSLAKTRLAGASHETSATIQERYVHRSIAIFAGFESSYPFPIFIGQGAIPIKRDGWTVGALGTGAEIGPFMKIEGVNPEQLLVDGEPANVEDLILSYALGGPYLPQHGDDMARWIETFGKPPTAGQRGSGLDIAPVATRQPILQQAKLICDTVISAAGSENLKIAVTVLDRNGVPIQQDRMDGASPFTVELAEAAAFSAICAGTSSEDAADRVDLAVLQATRRLSFAPGGIPIIEEGVVLGAVGVNGARHKDGHLARIAAENRG